VAAGGHGIRWTPCTPRFGPRSGEFVGVLSVDLPASGTRPGRRQRELLEILAIQAGIAIDNASARGTAAGG